ncbi:MAG: CHASE3 domain-containing protein [Edaphobacter sp.]|uniref:CHASE3 domain-containing protein n=1 Tax=Edaphobacter sp. TaxID=1934404 RepID=UPI002392FC95|nr:CHASE3 domain-containing protein [Edaphobacter sp.]MDE1175400.1 CHASE3 domain-containing protein [Edaphobacter sp.]
MNLAKFTRILRQALLLPVIALLLAAAALYLQIRSTNDTVGIIQLTDTRIAQASLVAKLIVDEESGLRGYETTGDERFLQPFTDAGNRLPVEFEKLQNLTEGDPQQRFNVEDLRNEHQTWRDAFALPITALVKAGGRSNDVNLNLYGKSLMDQVRQDIDSIKARAETRRQERIAEWHRQVRNLIEALIVVALGMGILIGLFMRSRLHAVSSAYRSSLEILSRRAEEIYQSEQQLRTTLDSIGDGVITCDIDGRIQMINPVACDLTGWPANEAVDRPLDEVFRIVSELTREPMEDPVVKVKRLKAAVGATNHTILIRKDSTELLIADSGAPVRDQTGETVGIVLVFRDITLERRTQEALVANEKLAVAGRLAATIAHEIHNPLDSVSNLLYLMKNSVSAEESAQFIDMAERELTRVTQISRAILGLYRESRAPVPVDLKVILEEILLLTEHRLNELDVNVRTDLRGPVVVDAFPAELRQVFTNLISNAAEAATVGGHEIHISVLPVAADIDSSGQKQPSGARIIIADNGPGVSPEDTPHLFQAFFTTKGEQGTGLGLWVSRGIVHKLGGTIDLTSETQGSGHGTTVTVFLAEKPTINTNIAGAIPGLA